MDAVVTALAVTAVKGTRLRTVEAIELGELGARGDRAFYVVDERGRLVNSKVLGALQRIEAAYEPGGELALTFPDGSVARGPVRSGAVAATHFHGAERAARELEGPWSQALSAYAQRPLRLVGVDSATDRGREGAASLISGASLRRLAREAGRDAVDSRRFRMLIEIDGVDAHEEDGWVGHRVRIGGALVAMHGHVGRCLITSRDPDSGEIDLPTLDLLGGYRRGVDASEPLPFGIYGEVLVPAAVRVGDPVELEPERRP
jgi:hypothetical protein